MQSISLLYRYQNILTSVLIMAAATVSPNQRPSEFTEGRELLENMQLLSLIK
jgi:hypothetical protein